MMRASMRRSTAWCRPRAGPGGGRERVAGKLTPSDVHVRPPRDLDAVRPVAGSADGTPGPPIQHLAQESCCGDPQRNALVWIRPDARFEGVVVQSHDPGGRLTRSTSGGVVSSRSRGPGRRIRRRLPPPRFASDGVVSWSSTVRGVEAATLTPASIRGPRSARSWLAQNRNARARTPRQEAVTDHVFQRIARFKRAGLLVAPPGVIPLG